MGRVCRRKASEDRSSRDASHEDCLEAVAGVEEASKGPGGGGQGWGGEVVAEEGIGGAVAEGSGVARADLFRQGCQRRQGNR